LYEWNNSADDSNIESKGIVKYVIGNKSDLGQKRNVSSKEGNTFAAGISSHYIETSALNASNVDFVFLEIGRLLISNDLIPNGTDSDGIGFIIGPSHEISSECC